MGLAAAARTVTWCTATFTALPGQDVHNRVVLGFADEKIGLATSVRTVENAQLRLSSIVTEGEIRHCPTEVDTERRSRTPVALVTGASRGIGAEVARQLGAQGLHVVVNYREKSKRALAVVDQIRAAGGQASVACADVCDEGKVKDLLADVAGRFGGLDVLVLNASGGLERDADPGYAMRLNRDAQLRLATQAAPLMPPGSRIVFVTSHQAHFYPAKAVPDG